MRKRLINKRVATELSPPDTGWLELESIVQVELTSEDADHPIESALIPGSGQGWRASQPGEQTIRLLFSEPMSIKRIRMQFKEEENERTQQFVLRWSGDGGNVYREIVRQQYNFNPSGATSELEDYQVSLDRVDALELVLIPDISGADSFASLTRLQLA